MKLAPAGKARGDGLLIVCDSVISEAVWLPPQGVPGERLAPLVPVTK
jgi:hypothetical protein